jgi:predicted dehydrogenase
MKNGNKAIVSGQLSVIKSREGEMSQLRIGIIGLGNMGTIHANQIMEGKVKGAELTAVCDINPSRLVWAKASLGDKIQVFDQPDAFLAYEKLDAVIICTLHYSHPDYAIKAFSNGLHVLIEKPAGVYTKQVREMNEAAGSSGLIFGIMYNQRTNPLYLKLKELIDAGELGEIRRTNWIMTDWYRSQSYYDSGDWRATWLGEGGGVLLNQCPHQLDLWQWTIGMMPTRIRSFCSIGKYRNIEVEDEVTAYVEYENGATGVFITTTGEATGTNRYEVIGDRGKITIENDQFNFWQLQIAESEFNRTNKDGFARPESWKINVPIKMNDENQGHHVITQNWVNGITKGTPLLAPGEEGIKGLILSNAMYLSTWLDQWIDIPFDEELYFEELQKRIARSCYVNRTKL